MSASYEIGSKLSYDDGVVRSTVVVCRDGRLLEVRRGELTGKALKAAECGARTWASLEEWLGPGAKDWAILGREEACSWTEIDARKAALAETGLDAVVAELKRLGLLYNSSRSVGARLYWADQLCQIAMCGYRWPNVAPLIKDRPDLVREIARLNIRWAGLGVIHQPKNFYMFHETIATRLQECGLVTGVQCAEWHAEMRTRGEGPVSIADLPDLEWAPKPQTVATSGSETDTSATGDAAYVETGGSGTGASAPEVVVQEAAPVSNPALDAVETALAAAELTVRLLRAERDRLLRSV